MTMREKLIELIKAGMHFGIYYDTVVRSSEVGEIADHLIANGVTIQKWLPVSERLPEQRVLIYFPNVAEGGNVRIGMLGQEGLWYAEGTMFRLFYKDITHWMPLPSTEGLK